MLAVVATLLANPCYGSSITIPYVFVPNTTIVSAQVNANFSTIAGVVNGNLDNSNLTAGANISLSKLNLTQSLLDLQGTGTTLAVGAGQTGDTVERVGFLGNGQLVFGPGTATAIDVGFTRTAASVLQLNNGTAGSPATLDMAGGNIINGSVPVPDIQGLRLSISATVPLPADGTSTTLYVLPFTSGYIALYNASNVWVTDVVTSLSIAMPATTATAYDVYVFDSTGTATIGLAAWSGSTPPTRGTQNGVPYTNNSKYDRWIGSVATNGTSGTTEDDTSARYVWNYNNQVPRSLFAQIAVASYTYNTSTWRTSDANTTNGAGRFAILQGLANGCVSCQFVQSTSSTAVAFAGMNLDATSGTPTIFAGNNSAAGTISVSTTFELTAGIHYIQRMEAVNGPTTTIFQEQTVWSSANAYGTSSMSGIVNQ